MTTLKRLLLYPFRILYQAIVSLRNFLFNTGFLKVEEFKVPVLSIGNLSVGGSGKTPMIIHLLDLLDDPLVLALRLIDGSDHRLREEVEKGILSDPLRHAGENALGAAALAKAAG